MSVSKEGESITYPPQTFLPPRPGVNSETVQKKFQQFQVDTLINQFLADVNPDHSHISAYFDEIIGKLQLLKREKLLKISSEAEKQMSENQRVVHQKLRSDPKHIEDQSFITNLISSVKNSQRVSSSYSLARSELHKITDIVRDAQQGLLPPQHQPELLSKKDELDLQDQFIKVMLQHSLPKNFQIKGQKHQKMPDNVSLSQIQGIEITYFNMKIAKILVEHFPNLKKLKINSWNDNRSGSSSYNPYGNFQIGGQSKDFKLLKQIARIKKLEEVQFMNPPAVEAEHYAWFMSNLTNAKTLILKNHMKTGACLVEILLRKRDYDAIKLFGSSNQISLSKQSLDFMFKTVPNLRFLTIDNPNLDPSQLEVISRFKQLEQLKLYSKDYETSQIDIYNYGYDEEGFRLPGSTNETHKNRHLEALLKDFPKMRSFTFNYRPVPVGGLQLMLNVFPPGLEELSIQTASSLPPTQFQFLGQFKNLKKLMLKSAVVSNLSIEALGKSKFRVKYLYINLSTTSAREERQKAQRRQNARQLRNRRALERERLAREAFQRRNLPEEEQPEEEDKAPQLILSPFLRSQTELEHVKIENRLTDRMCQDLSYLPNLRIIEMNIILINNDGYQRTSPIIITSCGFAYFSKLRKVQKITSAGTNSSIPLYSGQFFRFVRNNILVKPEAQDVQFMDEKVLRNMHVMGRIAKIDLNNRRQLMEAYRPRAQPRVDYDIE